MRIIDRYLIREISESWLAVAIVLLLIMIGNAFLFIFRRVSSGAIPADAITPFLIANLVIVLVGVIPFSLYLGVLIGLGRLYKDSEMAAMSACGIGGWSLYRAPVTVMVPALLAILFLTFVAQPWAARIEQAAKHVYANRSELAAIQPGRFNESSKGEAVLFVAELTEDRARMQDVFVHNYESDGDRGLETARSATQETIAGERYMVLENGQRYIGRPGQADFRIIEFERHGINVPATGVRKASLPRSGKTLRMLLESTHVTDHAELQWRLAIAVAAALLTMLAVPLSRTTPRKGRYAGLVMAVLLYLLYWNLLVMAKNWMQDGTTPAWLGLWWAHLPMLAVMVALILREQGVFSRRKRVT